MNHDLDLLKIGILLGRYTDVSVSRLNSLTGSDDPAADVSALLKKEFRILAPKGMIVRDLLFELKEAVRKKTKKDPSLPHII